MQEIVLPLGMLNKRRGRSIQIGQLLLQLTDLPRLPAERVLKLGVIIVQPTLRLKAIGECRQDAQRGPDTVNLGDRECHV
jgi:hypothetical protein